MKKTALMLVVVLLALLPLRSYAQALPVLEKEEMTALLSSQHPDYLLEDNSLILSYLSYYDAARKASSINPEGKTVSRKGVSRYIDFDDLTTLELTLQKVATPLDLFARLMVETDQLSLLLSDLTFNVYDAYGNYLSAKSAITQGELNLKLADLNLEQSKALFAQGKLSPLDLPLIAIAREEAEQALAQALLNEGLAQSIYLNALGYDLNAPESLPVTIPELALTVDYDLQPLSYYLTMGLTYNAGIQDIEQSIRNLEQEKHVYELSDAFDKYSIVQADYRLVELELYDQQNALLLEKALVQISINESYELFSTQTLFLPIIEEGWVLAQTVFQKQTEQFNEGSLSTNDYLKAQITYEKAYITYVESKLDHTINYLTLEAMSDLGLLTK